MNPSVATPPPLPRPQLSSPEPDPAELEPVRGIGGTIEALLRRPGGVLHHLHLSEGSRLVAVMILVATLAAAAYGFIVGTFSGGSQLWAAPLKISAGLMFCGVICLPSLYVFACLTGSTARFVDVAGMVAGLMALMTMLLVSFAPVAWVFSQSTESLVSMGTLHLSFWLIATYFGARFLYRGMARLGARGEGAFYFWICLFVVVALQMTTALRPIIGPAGPLLPAVKRSFLQHWSEQLRTESAKDNPAANP